MSKQNRQQQNRQEPQDDFQRRVKLYIRANEDLLERYQLASRPVVYFPNKKKVPLSCKIALAFIDQGGGIIDTKFKDLKKY